MNFVRTLLVFAFAAVSSITHAQLQSPEGFLGYKIGDRYTRHHRVVEYVQHLAANASGTVRTLRYGTTHEGRPLMVAYISSPENIANLENIRQNNLRLAGLESGTADRTPPAIVWLSYNVHGNETSSSEAAMLTLYALADPNNAQTKAWLRNTVVVLDPCLNPDGRDRYVNWFNSVAGKRYNPELVAREHREPWPGGRTNHYNFDLNRDWAWQTQVESQQRIRLYNTWLPQVHVDFHEQGINSPYYFAPAAQPYHEVITPFQRSFQNEIGRNHARYFDKEGWLYFTKEVFDLLYPSYGDTYPIYNGSIGMTYEQAGGPAGGASVIVEHGDTLTLADRVQHHHTTGLSTVEIASQNAARLTTEFQKFYTDAAAAKGFSYNSYLIKGGAESGQRIAALRTLLDKNGIRYSAPRSGASGRGFNYESGREESFTAADGDLLVSAAQPKGTLVNVLFEPDTKVVDSNTYDITAWSLPYAYGLKAFASRTPIAAGSAYASPLVPAFTGGDVYGYAIPWAGMGSVRLVSQLLQEGVKLRYTETPFSSGGREFGAGSVLVLRTSNRALPNMAARIRILADSLQVPVQPLASGFVDRGSDFGSSKVHPLKNRRVAILTGEGTNSNAAGEVWHYFDEAIRYPATLINVADFSAATSLRNFDLLVMPDGRYPFLNDKVAAEALRNWVAGGGQIIALEGAVSALSKTEWAIKSKKADAPGDANGKSTAVSKYENRERDYVTGVTPGSIFRLELDNTHPLGFGFPKHYHTLKQDGTVYELFKGGGWNVGVLRKGRQSAGFVGSKLAASLEDGFVLGTQEIGNGSVTYFTDDVLFRSFWENGRILFANAVFLVGQ